MRNEWNFYLRSHFAQTYIPVDKNPNKIPKPQKIEAKKLIVSSLKMIESFCPLLLDTSNTKNHAASDVPTINKIAARCG